METPNHPIRIERSHGWVYGRNRLGLCETLVWPDRERSPITRERYMGRTILRVASRRSPDLSVTAANYSELKTACDIEYSYHLSTIPQ